MRIYLITMLYAMQSCLNFWQSPNPLQDGSHLQYKCLADDAEEALSEEELEKVFEVNSSSSSSRDENSSKEKKTKTKKEKSKKIKETKKTNAKSKRSNPKPKRDQVRSSKTLYTYMRIYCYIYCSIHT